MPCLEVHSKVYFAQMPLPQSTGCVLGQTDLALQESWLEAQVRSLQRKGKSCGQGGWTLQKSGSPTHSPSEQG